MSIRIPVSLTVLFLVLFLATGTASAHPPAEHAEPAESTANHTAPPDTPPAAEETDTHAHEPGTAGDHHDRPVEAGHHDAMADDGHHEGAAASPPCGDDHAVPHQDGNAAAPGAATGHAHWGDHGPQTELERTIARLGVLHSVAVHFPIALMLAAALAQILAWVRPGAGFGQTVRFLSWTAAVGGVAAGLLGWAHAGPMATGEGGIMAAHRWIGTSLIFIAVAIAVLVEYRNRKPGASIDMIAGTAVLAGGALVAANGFLGGSLAHGGLRHLIGG